MLEAGAAGSRGPGTAQRGRPAPAPQPAPPPASTAEVIFSASGVEYACSWAGGWLKAHGLAAVRVLRGGHASAGVAGVSLSGLNERAAPRASATARRRERGRVRAAEIEAARAALERARRGAGALEALAELASAGGVVEAAELDQLRVVAVCGAAVVLAVVSGRAAGRRFALRFLGEEQGALFARLVRRGGSALALAPLAEARQEQSAQEHEAPTVPPTHELRAAIETTMLEPGFAVYADAVWSAWLALQAEVAEELAMAAAMHFL